MVMSADDEFEESSISNPKLTVPSSSRLELIKLLLLEIFCPDSRPEPTSSTPLMMISGIGLVGALGNSFWKWIKNHKLNIFWPRETYILFWKRSWLHSCPDWRRFPKVSSWWSDLHYGLGITWWFIPINFKNMILKCQCFFRNSVAFGRINSRK